MSERLASSPEQIEAFLAAGPFAVAGASEDPAKFGHRVFACYLRRGLPVYAVNPRGGTILGQVVYPTLASLPEPVRALSIVTPPAVTEGLVEDAITLGIRHVWMQPGAESEAAVKKAEAAGISVIHGGPCLLVRLGC